MGTSFEQGRCLVLEAVAPLDSEKIRLAEAAGRVLACAVTAPYDLPRFDNTAMDGFAVRAGDCRNGASLSLVGTLPAGFPGVGVTVEPGTAVRIMTGAPIPAGADAVVPLEEAAAAAGLVRIKTAVTVGQHIRTRGEDVGAGVEVLAAGTRLRPPELSLLASFGAATVAVFRRPRVAILSTGDELVELGEIPGPGQIVNSNALALAAAVREAGGEPWLLGIARDNVASLSEKLRTGLAADLLVTSAGVSSGDHDLVRAVLGELGVEERFWRLDIKPGRPTAFGMFGRVPVFSLPGNPVSSLVTFQMLVRPALRRLGGEQPVEAPPLRARLLEPLQKKPGRVQFLRVRVEVAAGEVIARSAGDQNTGILRTLLRANALALLPAEWGDVAAGTPVDVYLFSELAGGEAQLWPMTGREG